MDDWAARDKTLPDLIARNKRAILAALAQHNVASAQVLFEGYADSGQVEDPDFAFNGPECDLSSVAVPFESCLRPDDIQIKNMPLNKAITSLCYDILEHRHGGWEINEGSDGFFFFDAKTQKLEFNFAYKVREETCTEI
jgi:hypothetical protein